MIKRSARKENSFTGAELLILNAKKWEKRRRVLSAWSLVVNGLFLVLPFCALIALLTQLFSLPFQPALWSFFLILAVILICSLPGLIRKKDYAASFLAADRRLGLKERLSTAYELLETREDSPFSGLLVSDAVHHIEKVKPGDVYPAAAPKKLKYLPIFGIILAVLLLVDFGLTPSPTGSAGGDQDLEIQGRKLEELGKRLAARARRDFLPETLNLAQEMERLGNDLQRGKLDRDEAIDRLSDLAGKAEQQSRELQRKLNSRQGESGAFDQNIPNLPLTRAEPGTDTEGKAVGSYDDETGQEEGSVGGAGGPESEDSEWNLEDGLEDGSGYNRRGVDEEARRQQKDLDSLNEAGKGLRSSEGALAFEEGLEGSDSEKIGGSGQITEGEGDRTDLSEQSGAGQERQNSPGDPGTRAAEDEKSGDGRYAGKSEEEPSKLQGFEQDREKLKGIIRALPLAADPEKPLDDRVHEYSRQLEDSILKEEVPLNYRSYIRDYFINIGMLENDRE
jgi:hypothetical protein